MKKKLFGAFLTIYSCHIYAQPIIDTQTPFFDHNPNVQPTVLPNPSRKTLPRIAPPPTSNSIEEQINFAVLTKSWKDLEILLHQYAIVNNYDPILYNYALGALYRHQGKQEKAIQRYQDIAKTNPELYYPRFDLAIMLFEDQRYTEAKTELHNIQPYLSPNLQPLINQLLNNIEKSQKWQYGFNISYRATNNVNQASNLKELTLGNAVFIRNEDSLPQSAHGIEYYLSAAKEKNITGNQYITINTEIGGTSYWDNHTYDENTLTLTLGYKYKNLKQSFAIKPLVQQNFLNHSRYNLNYGGLLEYNRILNMKWQLSGSISHLNKNYNNVNISNYYNGHSNSTAWTLIYQPESKWLIFSGFDYIHDNLVDKAESSNRQGLRAGFVYSGKDVGVKGNIRYAYRNFFANNFWYNKKREDNEYQASATIWYKNWNWRGFSPKLNYNYQKIDSNLPLYERNNNSWFITVDKTF